MSTTFATGSSRHTDLGWDASDNVGWHDWACWVPGRRQGDAVTPPEPPALRLVHSQSPTTTQVRLDPTAGECDALHRAPLRTA